MNRYFLGAVGAALGLLAAQGALAQTPACGGLGANGSWIGGSQAGSDIATAGAALDGSGSAPMNGEIVTLFSLSSPTEVRVEARPGPGGDTVIDLLDAAGGLVISDDDGGGGLASRAEVMLGAGAYCLLTRGLGGDAVTADIRIGRTEHPALTAGSISAPDAEGCRPDTPAAQLGMGALMTGDRFSATNPVSVERHYRFSLDGSMPVTLTAEGESADPVLYLYDGMGNLVAENDDSNGLNSRIDLDVPPMAGQYCVTLAALSDENAPITLTVFEYSEAEYLRGLYNRGEAAPPLDGSHPFTALGSLQNRARQDVRATAGVASWFSVDLPEGGVLLVEAIAVDGADPTLTLFDDLGRRIGYNDDNADSLDSLLAVRVVPGTYILALNLLGEEGGAVRLAFERFARVP